MMQATYWTSAAAMIALAVLAYLAERRHARRRDPDRVGLVAWPFVQFVGIGAALILAALAITER